MTFKFGDVVENGWASEDNPTRTGVFVRKGSREGTMNAGPYIRLTDMKGKFWESPIGPCHRLKVIGSVLVAPGADIPLGQFNFLKKETSK